MCSPSLVLFPVQLANIGRRAPRWAAVTSSDPDYSYAVRPVAQPPELEPDTLRITPLGGLGDVGRNCATFEINRQILMVDCGVLFPDESHPGVDLILPGLPVLSQRLQDIRAIVLTHGHQDHIGSVPYLLKMRRDIPVLGSRFTLALLREQLKEHRLGDSNLREVRDWDHVPLGDFNLEFLPVGHSIPDSFAIVIRTKNASVLHTGDFKMDQLPADGRLTDLQGFVKAGQMGVDLLMIDSTNAELPGFTPWERDVQKAIDHVFASAKGKLVAATFSSHIVRVQQLINAAAKSGRKVSYVGRSMTRNMSIAAQLGYLDVPPGVLIDNQEIGDYPDHEVVVISTGSQGEPLSALSRMASGQHRHVALGPGDTVLLASSLIPGNETSVGRVINALTNQGVRIVHKRQAFVHVSGHASSGELLYVYNLVKPRNVMPVHGEARQLAANAELAASTGIPRENIFVVEDGVVLDLRSGVCKAVGKLDCSYVFVDGSAVEGIRDAQISDRLILGKEGFISVVAVVDLHAGILVEGPVITSRGFLDGKELFDAVSEETSEALVASLKAGVASTAELQQVMRRTIGRWVSRTHQSRPMIVPIVVST